MALEEAPPRRTLSSRIRREHKDTDRSSSTSSLTSQVDDAPHGLMPTLDGAFGKLKERARKSTEDRRNSEDSRLSRLIPTSKKSRKKSIADAASTKSIGDVSQEGSGLGVSPNPSELSLGLQGSGHSSLLTEDDEEQSISKPLRPTVSPHQSHAGYLTLSSPSINASTTDPSLPGPEDLAGETLANTNFSNPESLRTPNPSSEPRQSPVDRFKGAFTLPKKKPLASEQLPTRVLDDTSHEELPKVDIDQDKASEAPRPSTPQAAPLPPPSIITTVPSTPPNINNTPTTFVTPPTPTSPPSTFSNAFASNGSSPTSLNAASQRRKRAGTLTSSKLSTALNSSPLTPHIEEAKTPGGTLTAAPGSSGFFSSVFSAAQNAANQFSNTINTSIANNNQKNRSPQQDQASAAGGEEVIPGLEVQSSPETDPAVKRQLAVETLGKGDLSLDQLGITESEKVGPMTSNTNLLHDSSNFSQSNGNSQTQKQEESAAQRAISAAYEKPVERAVSQAVGGRPLSVVSGDGSDAGLGTPPRPASVDGVKRAGSVRSKLSGRRRHRGSSAATGGTLAAAISASTAALVNPSTGGLGHRATGFAVASSKRNKDFHGLFRSVPEDDYLIEDYSAALQRDILLHGRLYVSEAHICFSSNILGWVTNLIISFDEVVSVEKKSTAVIFPNAIVIQTLHARNVFASLVARDSTYELIVGIWKIGHPNLKSSLHGVALDDATTGDKTERAESVMSEEVSDQGSDDEVYDEDDEDIASFYEPGGSVAGSDIGGEQTVSRKPSAAPVTTGPPAATGATKSSETTAAAPSGAPAGQDFSGPATHAATDCEDQETHYDRPLTDITIPAPLGKVYSLMWGPQSSVFMKKWLVEDQKSRELAYEDDKNGLDDTHRTVTYSYIKPLNAPVGPRQTKCITTCTLDQFDLEKAVSVSCSTLTPDVPSGNIFTTKTKYCLMWGPGNSTRLVASCTIEWTGKSWLRGPIEKGANDGQIQYVKDIVLAIRAAVVAKAVTRGAGPRGKGGKGRRKNDPSSVAAEGERIAVAALKVDQQSDWGLFEPIRSTLEPFTSILQPLFSAQIIITVLVLILAYIWLFPSRKPVGLGFPIDSPGRLAAYEEIWRREESELWDWLEDRVGFVDGVPSVDKGGRQKALGVKGMGRKLRDGKMEKRQVEDAIRVTEERLFALKDAVRKRKEQ